MYTLISQEVIYEQKGNMKRETFEWQQLRRTLQTRLQVLSELKFEVVVEVRMSTPSRPWGRGW